MEKRVLSPEDRILLSQTEKLFSAFLDRYRDSTLGSLVKGIIHNLNGSLQILSVQLELLQRALLKEGDKINPSLNGKADQCLEQLDKMRALLETLMERGIHDDQEGPRPIHLNDLLEEEVGLQHHNLFFKHHIQVVKSFSRPLPPLTGYYLDFAQAFANLIQNAVEAMAQTPIKELAVATLIRDDRVQVTIRDTGCGISEEIRPDLFKPFCTSKGGKHPGLGLFIARELLAPYGASFSYSSRAGETTFSIHFPVAPGRAD